MQYLSGGKEMSKRFEGANSYTGTRADDYDEIRKKKKEWKVSEDIVFNLLKDIRFHCCNVTTHIKNK
mgnify:CR=1 FL=1